MLVLPSRTLFGLLMLCWQENRLGLMLDLNTFPHSDMSKINEFLQYLQAQKRVEPAKVACVLYLLVLPASPVHVV